MENQLQNQEQVNLIQKKEWIEPMMETLNLNAGAVSAPYDGSAKAS